MPERWQHELRKIKSLEPPAGLWDQVTLGSRRPERRLVHTYRTWPIIAAALAVSVLVAAFVLVRAFGSASTGPAGHAAAEPPAPPALVPSVGHAAVEPPGLGGNGNLYPLGPPGSGAVEKTVGGAQAQVGFPVPLPDTPAASPANLTHVWVGAFSRQVALVFDKGKVDILLHRATYQSDLRYFRTFVAENRDTRIGQVNGQPALIIWPGNSAYCPKEPPGPAGECNPAVVEFNRNGVDVSIYSHAYGTRTLLAIANSMR